VPVVCCKKRLNRPVLLHKTTKAETVSQQAYHNKDPSTYKDCKCNAKAYNFQSFTSNGDVTISVKKYGE
jgi:hypothetical protein